MVNVQAVGDWTTKVYNKLNFELSALQRLDDQSIPHDFLPVHVDGPYVRTPTLACRRAAPDLVCRVRGANRERRARTFITTTESS
jgi:hypothetical protein